MLYHFLDGYLHSRIGGAGRMMSFTAYGSEDQVGDGHGNESMNWSNLLVGTTGHLGGRQGALDARFSATRFRLNGGLRTGDELPYEADGELARVGCGLSASRLAGSATLSATLEFDARRVRSVVHVPTDTSPPIARETRVGVFQGAVNASFRVGRGTADLGLRLDATSHAAPPQPRLRVTLPVGERSMMTFAYARAARLYQLLTDPQAEPSLTFLDLWFEAGADRIPVPVVDHVTASWEHTRGPLTLSAATFASLGRGIGELRPFWDPSAGGGASRFGDSRTLGLELRAARTWHSPSGPSLSLAYVLSMSERRWEGDTWVPWQLDRRHLLRAGFTSTPGRWAPGVSAEAMSGQPMALVRSLVFRDPPGYGFHTPGTGQRGYLYAPEGSARSDGTFRLDAQATRRFDGPGDSNIFLGLAVTNLSFGPVAPQRPVDPTDIYAESDPSQGVSYVRTYSVPPVPSILLRITF